MLWGGKIETQYCLPECLGLLGVDQAHYCRSGDTGYCCSSTSEDPDCYV